ncbi:30S ribosomal protein S16 [Solitalea canadensis]|uniref:Small ribosomal subunit protein bS16 n=1 Tax=Solitalea canadensis (strain ATCC 29591 / DSM 3403 / JCM 21819 / LMG 8368 / NBRC 15130 / NCIMB 12057 / USAM 9D) TaxID=929556 RepID=H8KLL9_SOLCM|nr:30S ribosomal protein S16 [Solitalea canadensis]AFD08906.1 ribosomal protein S16 [Solitalea canadensis DSM 3403]
MPAKIRLQRHGKKGNAFYHIVVADSRAPRDGKFIERIGSYNPNTNPATIDLNVDKGVQWLQNGAQPTDTVRGILSYKGVLYKKHLLGGVTKGALTAEQADAKFAAWLEAKETKINAKKTGLANSAAEIAKVRFAEEVKLKEQKAAAIAAKNAPVAEEAPAAEEAEAPATEENNEAAAE